MPTHLSASDDAKTAMRVASLLRDAGLPTSRMRLYLRSHTEHGALMEFDEQAKATGSLTTNLLSLFDDIFEWGSLVIDNRSYPAAVRHGVAVLGIETDSGDEQALATRALTRARRADPGSGERLDRPQCARASVRNAP